MNPRQRGNPVLEYIKNVPWSYDETLPSTLNGGGPDYVCGTTALFYISLRIHKLKPLYIRKRIDAFIAGGGTSSYRLLVVLCHVDVDGTSMLGSAGASVVADRSATKDSNSSASSSSRASSASRGSSTTSSIGTSRSANDLGIVPLGDLNKICAFNKCTLMVGWSYAECARYIETYHAYDKKPATMIQQRLGSGGGAGSRSSSDFFTGADPGATYMAQLTDVLTAVRAVNKTDVVTLASTFGSLRGICAASEEQLRSVPGLGPRKVKRLWAALHGPLMMRSSAGPEVATEAALRAAHEDSDSK